jgi:hypothetical protein
MPSPLPIHFRFGVTLLPAAVSALLLLAVSRGLSLGAGEKDVFWPLLALLWSLLFAVAYLVGWWRGLAPGRTALRGAQWASGLLLAPVVLWLAVWLLRALPHLAATADAKALSGPGISRVEDARGRPLQPSDVMVRRRKGDDRIAIGGTGTGADNVTKYLVYRWHPTGNADDAAVLTQAQAQESVDTQHEAQRAWDRAVTQHGYTAEARERAIADIKTLPGVEDAGLSPTGTMIWIVYTTGIRGGVLTRPPGTRSR